MGIGYKLYVYGLVHRPVLVFERGQYLQKYFCYHHFRSLSAILGIQTGSNNKCGTYWTV